MGSFIKFQVSVTYNYFWLNNEGFFLNYPVR